MILLLWRAPGVKATQVSGVLTWAWRSAAGSADARSCSPPTSMASCCRTVMSFSRRMPHASPSHLGPGRPDRAALGVGPEHDDAQRARRHCVTRGDAGCVRAKVTYRTVQG